jgi:DNA-binding Xre family transcriptional regulator
MGMSEKIKIVLLKKKMTVTKLAEKIGSSSQNLSNKLSQDNFREKELQEIAEALDCDYEANFVLRDTGEKV